MKHTRLTLLSARFLPAGKRSALLFFALTALLSSAFVARADWPEFRGPTGDGHVSSKTKPLGLPMQWSETENLRWKTEIPEHGWSTPAIMGGQVWLTSATEDGHDFFVLCVDAETGKIICNDKLFHCDKPEVLGNPVNTYATPSPALEPGRVYVHFGSYGTACLDTSTRKVLWQRQDLPCRHYRGPSSSPIIFENLLILTLDGVDLQYVVALDKATGKTVWKTDRSIAWNDQNSTDQMVRDGDRRKAHSTPLIVKVDGKFQMFSSGAKAAYAYDPRTGKELWRVHFDAWSAAARPVYSDGLVFISTGYATGKTELLAIRVDGQGDVTDTHIAWRTDKMVPKNPSPVIVDGLLYMTADDGACTCLEPKTGNVVWQQHLSGTYAASPIYGDGHIYFFNQQGKALVLKPGRTFEALATNTLSSGMLASPAVSGKALFLRTKTHLNRIEVSK